ncbi:hypothetical protein KFK09_025053 [Dendrobium nobile]|uniref:Uncharacterized protein n=1 Tax=Dendrobium nobile TaxID=94219 RepID=A0A8T3AEZ2_DENNO|nr:hypothetical protein KFK09_025053 [Dendrobium nobile]
MADMLSQSKSIGWLYGMRKSVSSRFSQMVSAVAAASARYSDSVDDLATVFCFLTVQEMRVLPRKVQCPVVDFRVLGSPAQSASE